MQQAGLAGGADSALDMGFAFGFFAFFGRTPAIGVKDGAPGAGVEADAAIDAEKRVDLVLFFGSPEMAPSGHFLAQAPHPTQASSISCAMKYRFV